MYLCVELEEDKDLDLELQWLAGWVPFQAADPGIWEPAAPTLFFGLYALIWLNYDGKTEKKCRIFYKNVNFVFLTKILTLFSP